MVMMAGRLVSMRSQIDTFFAGFNVLDDLEAFEFDRLALVFTDLRPAVAEERACFDFFSPEYPAPFAREAPETNAPDLVIGFPSDIVVGDFDLFAVEADGTDRFVGRLRPVADEDVTLCCFESLICVR